MAKPGGSAKDSKVSEGDTLAEREARATVFRSLSESERDIDTVMKVKRRSPNEDQRADRT